MGQKVHPIGMRVGIIRDWDAKWYAEKEYADYLHEDLAIRKFINKELADASVSTIEIERAVNKVIVSLHTAKPGMVIGKGCLLYTSPSPRDATLSRMPSSA